MHVRTRALAAMAAMAMLLTGCASEPPGTTVAPPSSVPAASDSAGPSEATVASASPTSTPSPSPSPTPTVVPSPTKAPSSTAAASGGTTPTARPADTAGDPVPAGTLTALIIGTDSLGNDWSGLSDMIIIAQLSADRKQLALVSIARDTCVDIPGRGQGKINSAFGRGHSAAAADGR